MLLIQGAHDSSTQGNDGPNMKERKLLGGQVIAVVKQASPAQLDHPGEAALRHGKRHEVGADLSDP